VYLKWDHNLHLQTEKHKQNTENSEESECTRKSHFIIFFNCFGTNKRVFLKISTQNVDMNSEKLQFSKMSLCLKGEGKPKDAKFDKNCSLVKCDLLVETTIRNNDVWFLGLDLYN
jgi:hypothetical protein